MNIINILVNGHLFVFSIFVLSLCIGSYPAAALCCVTWGLAYLVMCRLEEDKHNRLSVFLHWMTVISPCIALFLCILTL